MEPNKINKKEEFPGYPHYPASEDITNKNDDIKDVSEDQVVIEEEDTVVKPEVSDEEDTEADVTEDEIRMLSAADQNRNMEDTDLEESLLDTTDEDGELLNEPGNSYGKDGKDLDIPGSEADDANEAIGEEDEENNYYSLGGDNHDNLEEDNGNEQ